MRCIDHFGARHVRQQHQPVVVRNAQGPQRSVVTEQRQTSFVGVERVRLGMGRENCRLLLPRLPQHGVSRQIQIEIRDSVVNHVYSQLAVPEPAVAACQFRRIGNDGLQSMALEKLPE